MKNAANLSYSLFFISCSLLLSSCSVSKQINKQAEKLLFADSAIRQGHIGISIYDPSSRKYLYNHNADKYFIPASNTKLFTWYAGMKYLGDSLVGLRYAVYDSANIIIKPTGDPTFLVSEFKNQPVYNFLKRIDDTIHVLNKHALNFPLPFGKGWQIDDNSETYQVPRSEFPIYGNLVTFSVKGSNTMIVVPKIFNHPNNLVVNGRMPKISLGRKTDIFENRYIIFTDSIGFNSIQIPFRPTSGLVYIEILGDTLQENIKTNGFIRNPNWIPIHTQPTDSLFKPMMHRSDNFYAEQTLMMAANERVGSMNDQAIIDTLLRAEMKDIPQKPRWVDGSGLSRYNLFTPQSFVWLLNKTKNEFDWERIKNILPTGGEGTLSSYYKNEAGFIYAKTGTLSNNCALSGYLITKKNKLLIFSVLVNNYPTSATPVRRAVENFIKKIREIN